MGKVSPFLYRLGNMLNHTSFIHSQKLSTLFFSTLSKTWNYNFGTRHALGNILKNIVWQVKNGGFEGLRFNLSSCSS